MKILETIQGATENIVVYENSKGWKVTRTRPRIIPLSEIIKEIEEEEKKENLKNGGNQEEKSIESTPVTVEESKTPEKTPNTPPKTPPNEAGRKGSVNNQRTPNKNQGQA